MIEKITKPLFTNTRRFSLFLDKHFIFSQPLEHCYYNYFDKRERLFDQLPPVDAFANKV